ncbi:activating signal cointegrator 1 complex subunit 1 [Chlorella sorokiniana]|uniref:Activating signal cointegrator 1 complex subunit 1 n=1 Tax=Chlorella sorokiniana TaxID=3076 RepID=A0A2P6U1Z0_CHLSO|nr:activating signal cointegrator 1 complex subunit 1 [Chlorella sorokiniana]|eukprot:PRW60326.1 activating signal cointegrator 1 complex subunit 1 [Chlorella sorokiniana]
MTDLLHPELLDVDGRVYRVLATSLASASGRRPGSHPQRTQQRHYEAGDDAGEEESSWGGGGGEAVGCGGGGSQNDEQASVPIRQEGDSFVARMRLDSDLFPVLIGRQGATKRRVEDDTGASISIPGRGTQGAPVVIKGPSRGIVARACTQLDLIVGQALAARGPRSLDYNYFLCLPLATPELSAAFESWRDAVLAEPGAAEAGLEASVFMHPQHLHLTIAMLKLYSEEQRDLAKQTLAGLQPRVQQLLGGAPLRVRLQVLEYMNDDPSQMHVMYLGVKDAPDSPGSLQRVQQLCAAVVEAFSAAGLLLPQDDRAVKLHATVLNTRYRRRSSGSGSSGPGQASGQAQQQGQQQPQGRGQWEQRRPFDGRQLLQRHGAVDFGAVQLPAVHISQRGQPAGSASGVSDVATGFYRCAASLALS